MFRRRPQSAAEPEEGGAPEAADLGELQVVEAPAERAGGGGLQAKDQKAESQEQPRVDQR